jgi:hypothetical protein
MFKCPFTKIDKRKVEIYHSVADINKEEWNSVLNSSNIYLSLPYLKAIEESQKKEISFFYVLVKNEQDEPVFIQYLQLVEFIDNKKTFGRKLFKNLHGQFDANKGFSVNILLCGNVFSDGENGFCWSEQINSAEAVKMAGEIAESISTNYCGNRKAGIILFKDFWPESTDYADHLLDQGYQDFMIDVNMIAHIHPSWKNIENYLSSMKTKYRTRAKSVFSKAEALQIKSLNCKEILDNEERINQLFRNVQSKSEYLMGSIKASAFGKLKDYLKNDFSFRAVFFKEEIIGFSTSFFHKGIMEANYVGIDYAYNKTHAVYQFLLYDYIYQAINSNSAELHLGRTSELVKSSLGAVPVNMKLYGKHKSKIANIFVSTALRSVTPSKFELRKPFKAKFIEEWTH